MKSRTPESVSDSQRFHSLGWAFVRLCRTRDLVGAMAKCASRILP